MSIEQRNRLYELQRQKDKLEWARDNYPARLQAHRARMAALKPGEKPYWPPKTPSNCRDELRTIEPQIQQLQSAVAEAEAQQRQYVHAYTTTRGNEVPINMSRGSEFHQRVELYGGASYDNNYAPASSGRAPVRRFSTSAAPPPRQSNSTPPLGGQASSGGDPNAYYGTGKAKWR